MFCEPIDAEETRPSKVARIEPETIFDIGEVVSEIFQVRAILGEGGMGCVYEAYESQLDRSVALKALWADMDPRRLQCEAQVLASLRHPSLVAIHGMGNHRDIPYLILERLRGQTLGHYAATLLDDPIAPSPEHRRAAQFERANRVERVLDILLPIAEALEYIHGEGVVHCDLKPANIMITDTGRVVLLDFGLHGAALDEPGRIRGTPHYMAPELVVQPDRADTPAIDIYALGVIAYELLTGHPPFDGRHAIEILRKQVRGAIPSLDRECRYVSEHLCRLINEMLAKDPNERPSTAGEVALWMRALRDGVRRSKRSMELSVLIADDDPEMLQLLSACVEFATPQARIRTVSDGAQALAMFQVECPQVLIVDIDMPRMGGIELCEHLYRTGMLSAMSVVPVSGRIDDTITQLLATWGIPAVLDKRQHSHQFLTELMTRLAGERVETERGDVGRAPTAPWIDAA